MSGPNTRNDPLQYDLGSPAKALVLMHDSINSWQSNLGIKIL